MKLKNSLRNLQGSDGGQKIRTPGRYWRQAGLRLRSIPWLFMAACSAASPQRTPSAEAITNTYTPPERLTSSPVATDTTAPREATANDSAASNQRAATSVLPDGEPPNDGPGRITHTRVTQGPGPTAAPVHATVHQLLTAPVTHVTAGKRRGAALTRNGDEATLRVFALEPGGNAGHPALPLSDRAPDAVVQHYTTLGLYMGRDDWPRVITYNNERVAASIHEHYFRFRPGKSWEQPRDEQGGLWTAGRAAGFYGVLGHEDPEVLCAPGAFCYEKRQSGWGKRSLPGDGPWSVRRLANGEAWAWVNFTGAPLCRVGDSWQCTLPHPGGALRALAHVGSKYVALTDSGLSNFDGTWTSLLPLAHGRDLYTLDETRALVLTAQGFWVWDGSLHRVQHAGTDVEGGVQLAPVVGRTNAFIVGGEHGVVRVDFE